MTAGETAPLSPSDNRIHFYHPGNAYLVLCGTADWWAWSITPADVTRPACLAKLEGRAAL